MASKFVVNPRTFSAIQRVDVDELLRINEQEIKPILPCLVRMSLCVPLDQSNDWVNKRQAVLKILSGIEPVNSLVALLSIDFHALEVDVKKEQQLRMKLGGMLGESVLIQNMQGGLALNFEHSDAARKLRLLLSELLVIMAQVKENKDFGIRPSELFDNEVYLEEISDVLCIAIAELPGLLQMQEVAESLLHVRHGPYLLCRVVANSPDSFKEVCYNLLLNGEKQDEDGPCGRIRLQALRSLCQMNMSQALAIKSKAVETCRMPGLSVLLSLDYCRQEQGDEGDFDSVVGDLVAFVSGLLLGSDDKVRTWFSQYVRNCQKKSEGVCGRTLHTLREELLYRLQNLALFSIDHHLPDTKVVQASALLRLYCALRGIAGLKFQEEEINLLIRLLTSYAPASGAGIRFVSLGLCMLLACPSLLGTHDHEKRVIEWIRWLLREESYFGKVSGMSASFGEMLLLVAIHFHSNQTSSISDLVCSTLGMKVIIRANNLARMKTIFTQEIFTDQVVTAHAVKVPVTPDLSGNTQGFLPVHCIHQLLKSRAFTKHKVPIKDWIYKQVCHTVSPLHPVLPALIEVYVSSVLIPASKSGQDTTNEPISENEIMAIFQNSTLLAPTAELCSPDAMDVDKPETKGTTSLTAQLLLLYYVLLYEDTRLSSVRSILSSNRNVKRYSTQFMSQLPILYLVQQAQRQQQHYAGLFAPLLRLLATHYPHLCLVKDWLAEDAGLQIKKEHTTERNSPNNKIGSLIRAFESMTSCPIEFQSQCQQLLLLPPHRLWGYAGPFIERMPLLLQEGCPRELQEQAKNVWLKLNAVFPRRLWVMTVNTFHQHPRPLGIAKALAWDDIVLDPLHVLRCQDKVFRCPPLMEITLHMLRAFLAASSTHLSHHLLEHPLPEKGGLPPPLGGILSNSSAALAGGGDAKQVESEKEREELCVTLVAAQQSASVQVLLECCLPKKVDSESEVLLTRLREVQSLICSHLHQVFISDPALVKLVQFQGYPSELLPIAVSSIPSMHICLDFIPELLSQPYLEKQVFAIELASYLSIQYAIPKSLNIAKLCINIAHTLLGVLTSERRPSFFQQTLPALVRMCRAFPPLCEDVVRLLLQLGKVCLSHSCVLLPVAPSAQATDIPKIENCNLMQAKSFVEKLPSNNDLYKTIQIAFADLTNIILLDRTIY